VVIEAAPWTAAQATATPGPGIGNTSAPGTDIVLALPPPWWWSGCGIASFVPMWAPHGSWDAGADDVALVCLRYGRANARVEAMGITGGMAKCLPSRTWIEEPALQNAPG
jgi:hypothetical protein